MESDAETVLQPILRAVKTPRDFDRVFRNLVNHDIGQRCKDQFPPALHADTGPPEIRKIAQPCASVIDSTCDPAGSLRVVAFNPFANVLQIVRGG